MNKEELTSEITKIQFRLSTVKERIAKELILQEKYTTQIKELQVKQGML